MKNKSLLLLLTFCLCSVLIAQNQQPKWLNIVYIGNSITQGVQIEEPKRNAPPVKASVYLHKQEDVGEVKFSNQGVSGSTTVDFLPQNNILFPKVKEAADLLKEDTWATLIFSIMLGTNDSAVKGPNGSPVSPEQYKENLKTIINELLIGYPASIVVLHQPLWYSPTTYNSSIYLQEGLDRLQTYFPEIRSLVTEYKDQYPDQVFLGDTEGFDFFREHKEEFLILEEGNQGVFYLHPNKEGAAKLGELWGKAIHRIINE